MTLRVHLALDSGAHSIYQQYIAAKTGSGVAGENISVQAMIHNTMDLSFYHGPKYKTYVEKYVAYVKEHTKALDFYVTLDIIFDPKRTWESTLYLESCGIKAMPVFHYGEDHSWFKKYLDRYEYIGVGGLGQTVAKGKYIEFANKTFGMICNKRGVPRVKIHGFAMGAFDLMLQWPWFSVDASSPFVFGRMGSVVLPSPVLRNGGTVTGWDFCSPTRPFAVTERRRFDKRSIENLAPTTRRAIEAYFEHLGFTLEQLQEYGPRDAANLYFFLRAAQEITHLREKRLGEAYPFKFYVSGKPGSGETKFLDTLTHLDRLGVKDLYYLGTFFLPSTTNFLLTRKMHSGVVHGNQRPRIRPQIGPTVPTGR